MIDVYTLVRVIDKSSLSDTYVYQQNYLNLKESALRIAYCDSTSQFEKLLENNN